MFKRQKFTFFLNVSLQKAIRKNLSGSGGLNLNFFLKEIHSWSVDHEDESERWKAINYGNNIFAHTVALKFVVHPITK